MSAATADPTPSPIPVRSPSSEPDVRSKINGDFATTDLKDAENAIKKCQEDITKLELRTAASKNSRPHPRPSFLNPKLHLKVLNLVHPGSQVFFANSNPTIALSKAVDSVLSILYEASTASKHIPPTRSITLVLRSMGGVAYTTGSDIDDDHKEIHFSLDYIHHVSNRPLQPGEPAAELQGVLVHEMVHCWQWNGMGTAPSGLIEGIADFVRLKAGLSAVTWKREAGGKWDAGYQTTGYFLKWIESRFRDGSVREINKALQKEAYREGDFWNNLFGRQVTDMWQEYSESINKEKTEGKDKQTTTSALAGTNMSWENGTAEGAGALNS